jgi:hypothetical protein
VKTATNFRSSVCMQTSSKQENPILCEQGKSHRFPAARVGRIEVARAEGLRGQTHDISAY